MPCRYYNQFDKDFCCPCGGEGCTPGYWKQEHHFDSWPSGYAPGDDFNTVFGTSITIRWSLRGPADDVSNPTLLQALQAKGGGDNELARHGVAGLLSAAHPDVDYAWDVGEVIQAVQDGDADSLVWANEMGCPLNGSPVAPSAVEALGGEEASAMAAGCSSVNAVPNAKAINLQLLVLVLGAVVLGKRWVRKP
jgi:hypothetical protein